MNTSTNTGTAIAAPTNTSTTQIQKTDGIYVSSQTICGVVGVVVGLIIGIYVGYRMSLGIASSISFVKTSKE